MKVRKFFAPTSREALRLVREALGADAVVLSNRVVDGGVELVALTEENLTDWVDDGGTTQMVDGALPSWDQAFSSDAADASHHANARADAFAAEQAAARPVRPASSAAAGASWRDLPRDQAAAAPQHTPSASKGPASAASRPAQFPWRDAPPRSQATRPSHEASAPAARSLASDMAANAGRRDRTVALPGVLAAGTIADDGVSALAYKHRGLRGDEAGSVSPSASPYSNAGAYTQPDAGFTDADMADDEADVVWKPSGRVAASTPAAPLQHAAPQRPAAPPRPAAAATAPAAAFVPFTAASVRTPDAPQLASDTSVPATGASETLVPHADHAAALMKTNESKRSATRSIFARIFSRQSSTESSPIAASESAAAAMSRLEKHDADASVLGLQRAERRDEAGDASLASPSASVSSARRDAPLSASSATARGMGTASAPIIVQPTATREEALLAQQPASATLPQEARAMYESETYPQQDFNQYTAQADVQTYASVNESFETPSYPEGFSPQDFDAAIDAARNAEAAAMVNAPYVDAAATDAYVEAPAVIAEAAPALAPLSAPTPAPIPAAVALPPAAAVSGLAETKSNGMSFAPAHYTAQTRLKGMSTGQSTGHGVPFLHVAPNLQTPVHAPVADANPVVGPLVNAVQTPVEMPVAAPVMATESVAPASFVAPAPAADAPIFTANDVPSIDLGEVVEAFAAPQTVEAANLMETADASRAAAAPVMSAPAQFAAAAEAAETLATSACFAAAAASTPAEANHPRIIAGKVLSEMRTLCGTLGEQLEALESQSTVRPDPTRVAMTRMLLGCGFSAQLVRLLLARMPVVADAEQGLAWVKATFERNLPVLDNEDALMEQGGVFALMGPTGVGKTTTTAKLAARAVMRHGADRVALLTTDSYRIGAHEQLRIYGRILGVAVHAVKDAADLSLVLSELRNKHMVLIDTIGMSQRDRAVSEQVSMLCGSHLPVKRLLLLNATSHGDTLNEVVRAYGTRDASNGAASGLSGCIITKVDESNGIGAALDTVMRHRLPVHYVSNGQKVPEDLRVARRGFLIDNAFSERHRASPFQPDEDDLSMIFGDDGEAANMLSAGAGSHAANSMNVGNAVSQDAQVSEAHYG